MVRGTAGARFTRNDLLAVLLLVVLANAGVVCMQFLHAPTMTEQGAVFPSLGDVSQAEWDRLAARRIYFGHQSVGRNIIDGLRDVMRADPGIRLNIVESRTPAELGPAAFSHSRIGRNRDPESKIDYYVNVLSGEMGQWCELSLMKLCYMDVDAQSDVEGLFRFYQGKIEELREARPGLVIVHATIPLLRREAGLLPTSKNIAKKLLGKPRRGASANAARGRFNELLVETYSGRDPIFDIARIESSRPDGTRFHETRGERKVYATLPEYTDDGGHLNKRGRRFAAEQLLILLARMED